MNTTLQLLTRELEQGTITRADVERVLAQLPVQKSSGFSLRLTGSTLLYAIGGLVLLTGILFLVAQVWEDISSIGRVLLTLGLGLVSVAAGTLLYLGEKKGSETVLPSVLFGIGGLLTTPGIFVFLYEYGGDVENIWVPTIVFALMTVVYALLRLRMQNVVLTFFTIAHATAFVFALVAALTQDMYDTSTLYELLALVTGVAYLALSRWVQGGQSGMSTYWADSLLVRPLVFFGSLGFLGGLFALMTDYKALEVVYPFAVIALYYAGIQWQSRTMLILGSLFFIGYISYITAEYFADSIGWPLALIMLGAIFVGLGYVTLKMSKTFEK